VCFSVDQQRPARRMNDMGPRRMDGFGRSQGQPSAPQPRPQQRVQQRSVPQPRPSRALTQQQPLPARREALPQRSVPQPQRRQSSVSTRQQPQQSRQQPAPVRAQRPVRQKTSRTGWRIALQFIVGLAVIAGVAFAIVWLYVRYYQ
jgi:hypothetical protein